MTVAVSAISTETTGRVFNIQRCAIHDGPGIRTTVFLKGCPLSCSWCHNPEGIDDAPQLMINCDRCLSCRACSEACPVDEGGAVPAGEPWDRDRCTRCGSCAEACPAGAREIAGREVAVDELVEMVEKDRVFYEVSGGGVTFSGGEPLAQEEFLADCLQECRRRGLATAVDTCGLAARQTLLETASLTDLVLYDLKHMDPVRHRSETGSDNRAILENLRALSESGAEIWVRIPVIPGFNDDTENIEATGALLAALPRKHPVFLLPYHGIADGKRSRLEGQPAASPWRTPDDEALSAIKKTLERHGLEVTIGGSP